MLPDYTCNNQPTNEPKRRRICPVASTKPDSGRLFGMALRKAWAVIHRPVIVNYEDLRMF